MRLALVSYKYMIVIQYEISIEEQTNFLMH